MRILPVFSRIRIRSGSTGAAIVLLLLLSLLTSVLSLPLSHVDVLSLIDPITQFEDESEAKKVIPKSVFNVPIKAEPSLPPCPTGSRRVTESGPCIPLNSGIRLDDQFLLQSFSIFNRRKPTSPLPPYTPRKRKTTTTTPEPPVPVPTYVLEEEKDSRGPLDPREQSPTYQIQNPHFGTTMGSLPITTTTTTANPSITTSINQAMTPMTSQQPQPTYPTVSPESIHPTEPQVTSTSGSLPQETRRQESTSQQEGQSPILGYEEEVEETSTQLNSQEEKETTLLPTLPSYEDEEMTTDVELEPTTTSPEFESTTEICTGDEESSSHRMKVPTSPEPEMMTSSAPTSQIVFRDEPEFIDLWHPGSFLIFREEEDGAKARPFTFPKGQ